MNSARIWLLEDYVSVYQQAIEGLQVQLDAATEQFEEITETKRLREEEAKAVAAQKAKENEYADMVIAVNEAKADMDTAQQAYNDALAALDLCEVEDCSEPQGVVDAALEDLHLYEEIFYAADEAFQYVNEELRIKQEEAQAQALQKQRTLVFNMVKSDGKLVDGVVHTLNDRIDGFKKQMKEITDKYDFDIPQSMFDGKKEEMNGLPHDFKIDPFKDIVDNFETEFDA